MTKDSTSVGRDSDKFMLRFPDGMRGQIAEAAKAAGRSMNAEIVHRLEASFSLPGAVGHLLETYKSLEAARDEEASLTERLIEMYEAQKALNDLQQGIIDELLKARHPEGQQVSKNTAKSRPPMRASTSGRTESKEYQFIGTSRDVLLRPLSTLASITDRLKKDKDGNPILGDAGTPSRTPDIPGVNIPKRGAGAIRKPASTTAGMVGKSTVKRRTRTKPKP